MVRPLMGPSVVAIIYLGSENDAIIAPIFTEETIALVQQMGRLISKINNTARLHIETTQKTLLGQFQLAIQRHHFEDIIPFAEVVLRQTLHVYSPSISIYTSPRRTICDARLPSA